MKTVFIITALSTTIGFAQAQKVNLKDVPVPITTSFQKNFGSQKAHWDKEGSNYEANFEKDEVEQSVLFASDGSILETEKEIKQSELPAAVTATLKKEYADFGVEETALIDAKGVITYEAEVEKGKESFDLIFDAQGKLIKKIAKQKDKKE